METETEKPKIFTKVPATVCALGLGLACLGAGTSGFAGALAMPFLLIWAYTLAILAVIPLTLYILKIVLNYPAFKQDLHHPVFTCVIPAFAMATMILSPFLGLINLQAGIVLWFGSLGLHIVLTAVFFYFVIKGFTFEKFIPAYYIAPVGIVCLVANSAPFVSTLGANFTMLNEAILWYGLFMYIGLLPAMIARLSQRTIPAPKKATAIIMAAPPNLLVVGYITLGPQGVAVQPQLLLILVVFSMITTGYIYVRLAKLLRSKFNPGFAAFTFPTVISSIAMLKFSAYLGSQGNGLSVFFKTLGVIEFIIATVIVVYVAIGFLYFLVIKPKLKTK